MSIRLKRSLKTYAAKAGTVNETGSVAAAWPGSGQCIRSDGVLPAWRAGERRLTEMRDAVRYVLFYDSGDLSLAVEHFPAHKARLDEFDARGDLLMVGTFGDPVKQGSMAIFTTRELP